MKNLLLGLSSILLASPHLLAGPGEDERIILTCRGKVAEYRMNGGHFNYGRERPCEWFDIVSIEILSPKEWKGQILEVHAQELDSNSPLKQKERRIKFRIARIYLVKEYSNPDGTTNTHIPGNGALEIIEE